jgi:hypothetical protein
MQNKNESLSDSTYFENDRSFLLQDIEKSQKHAELFLIERRAAYQLITEIQDIHSKLTKKTAGYKPMDLQSFGNISETARHSAWDCPDLKVKYAIE